MPELFVPMETIRAVFRGTERADQVLPFFGMFLRDFTITGNGIKLTWQDEPKTEPKEETCAKLLLRPQHWLSSNQTCLLQRDEALFEKLLGDITEALENG